MLAFKLDYCKLGHMTFVRVYQGVLNKNQKILNTRTQKKYSIQKLAKLNANVLEEIEEAFSGDVAVILGIEDCASGDTLTNK